MFEGHRRPVPTRTDFLAPGGGDARGQRCTGLSRCRDPRRERLGDLWPRPRGVCEPWASGDPAEVSSERDCGGQAASAQPPVVSTRAPRGPPGPGQPACPHWLPFPPQGQPERQERAWTRAGPARTHVRLQPARLGSSLCPRGAGAPAAQQALDPDARPRGPFAVQASSG